MDHLLFPVRASDSKIASRARAYWSKNSFMEVCGVSSTLFLLGETSSDVSAISNVTLTSL